MDILITVGLLLLVMIIQFFYFTSRFNEFEYKIARLHEKNNKSSENIEQLEHIIEQLCLELSKLKLQCKE